MKDRNQNSRTFSLLKTVSQASLFLAAFLFLNSALKGEIINDVDFSTVYRGTVLPNTADPVWSLSGGGGTATIVDGMYLNLDLDLASSRTYSIKDKPAIWDGNAEGITIEFRMKVISDDSDHDAYPVQHGAVAVVPFAQGRYYPFYLRDDAVKLNNNVYDFDTSDFNVYRITITGSMATLYINNNPVAFEASWQGPVNSTNQIYFGDPSNGVGGEVLIDYIAFTDAGAFAPIPETGTISLLLGGVILSLLFVRNRKKK